MTRIVVAGEALVDRMLGPDGRIVDLPGGGPFNAARTMARLGADVAFLGRLSSDPTGRRLRDALAADGVVLDHAVWTDDPTTSATATLDVDGTASYHFDLDGTSAAGLRWADLEDTGLAADRVDVLHVGTLGLLLEPSGTTIERLVGRVRPDALVALDPNIRPSAMRDPTASRARIARLALRADVVKVSVDDLRALDPGGVPEAALGRFRSGGPAVVLVTDGAAPVEIVTPTDHRRLPVPQVDVVDTVGAGDAFLGGFLATWVLAGRGRGDLADARSVDAAVRVAIEVAVLTCRRAGAQPPTRAELDAHLATLAER
jgi:fructokinase